MFPYLQKISALLIYLGTSTISTIRAATTHQEDVFFQKLPKESGTFVELSLDSIWEADKSPSHGSFPHNIGLLCSRWPLLEFYITITNSKWLRTLWGDCPTGPTNPAGGTIKATLFDDSAKDTWSVWVSEMALRLASSIGDNIDFSKVIKLASTPDVDGRITSTYTFHHHGDRVGINTLQGIRNLSPCKLYGGLYHVTNSISTAIVGAPYASASIHVSVTPNRFALTSSIQWIQRPAQSSVSLPLFVWSNPLQPCPAISKSTASLVTKNIALYKKKPTEHVHYTMRQMDFENILVQMDPFKLKQPSEGRLWQQLLEVPHTSGDHFAEGNVEVYRAIGSMGRWQQAIGESGYRVQLWNNDSMRSRAVRFIDPLPTWLIFWWSSFELRLCAKDGSNDHQCDKEGIFRYSSVAAVERLGVSANGNNELSFATVLGPNCRLDMRMNISKRHLPWTEYPSPPDIGWMVPGALLILRRVIDERSEVSLSRKSIRNTDFWVKRTDQVYTTVPMVDTSMCYNAVALTASAAMVFFGRLFRLAVFG